MRMLFGESTMKTDHANRKKQNRKQDKREFSIKCSDKVFHVYEASSCLFHLSATSKIIGKEGSVNKDVTIFDDQVIFRPYFSVPSLLFYFYC